MPSKKKGKNSAPAPKKTKELPGDLQQLKAALKEAFENAHNTWETNNIDEKKKGNYNGRAEAFLKWLYSQQDKIELRGAVKFLLAYLRGKDFARPLQLPQQDWAAITKTGGRLYNGMIKTLVQSADGAGSEGDATGGEGDEAKGGNGDEEEDGDEPAEEKADNDAAGGAGGEEEEEEKEEEDAAREITEGQHGPENDVPENDGPPVATGPPGARGPAAPKKEPPADMDALAEALREALKAAFAAQPAKTEGKQKRELERKQKGYLGQASQLLLFLCKQEGAEVEKAVGSLLVYLRGNDFSQKLQLDKAAWDAITGVGSAQYKAMVKTVVAKPAAAGGEENATAATDTESPPDSEQAFVRQARELGSELFAMVEAWQVVSLKPVLDLVGVGTLADGLAAPQQKEKVELQLFGSQTVASSGQLRPLSAAVFRQDADKSALSTVAGKGTLVPSLQPIYRLLLAFKSLQQQTDQEELVRVLPEAVVGASAEAKYLLKDREVGVLFHPRLASFTKAFLSGGAREFTRKLLYQSGYKKGRESAGQLDPIQWNRYLWKLRMAIQRYEPPVGGAKADWSQAKQNLLAVLVPSPVRPVVAPLVSALETQEEARKAAEGRLRLQQEEARKAAEEQLRLQREEEARKAAEEQLRLQREEEARKAAEGRLRLQREEEARKAAEGRLRLQREEEARKVAEGRLRLQREEEARTAAEELRLQQEAALALAQRTEDEEAKRVQDEGAGRRARTLAEAKRVQHEEAELPPEDAELAPRRTEEELPPQEVQQQLEQQRQLDAQREEKVADQPDAEEPTEEAVDRLTERVVKRLQKEVNDGLAKEVKDQLEEAKKKAEAQVGDEVARQLLQLQQDEERRREEEERKRREEEEKAREQPDQDQARARRSLRYPRLLTDPRPDRTDLVSYCHAHVCVATDFEADWEFVRWLGNALSGAGDLHLCPDQSSAALAAYLFGLFTACAVPNDDQDKKDGQREKLRQRIVSLLGLGSAGGGRSLWWGQLGDALRHKILRLVRYGSPAPLDVDLLWGGLVALACLLEPSELESVELESVELESVELESVELEDGLQELFEWVEVVSAASDAVLAARPGKGRLPRAAALSVGHRTLLAHRRGARGLHVYVVRAKLGVDLRGRALARPAGAGGSAPAPAGRYERDARREPTAVGSQRVRLPRVARALPGAPACLQPTECQARLEPSTLPVNVVLTRSPAPPGRPGDSPLRPGDQGGRPSRARQAPPSWLTRATAAAAKVYPWLLAAAEFPPGSVRRLGPRGRAGLGQVWDGGREPPSWPAVLGAWTSLRGPGTAPWWRWRSCAAWGQLLAARHGRGRALSLGQAELPLVAPGLVARQLAEAVLSCAEDPDLLRAAWAELFSQLAGREPSALSPGLQFLGTVAEIWTSLGGQSPGSTRPGQPEPPPLELAMWSTSYQLSNLRPATAAALRCASRETGRARTETLQYLLGWTESLRSTLARTDLQKKRLAPYEAAWLAALGPPRQAA
eukprot:g55314.t1